MSFFKKIDNGFFVFLPCGFMGCIDYVLSVCVANGEHQCFFLVARMQEGMVPKRFGFATLTALLYALVSAAVSRRFTKFLLCFLFLTTNEECKWDSKTIVLSTFCDLYPVDTISCGPISKLLFKIFNFFI